MIKIYARKDNALQEIDAPEYRCWINVYPPFSHENLRKLGEELDIPFDFLIDSLDVDERSRFEVEDGIELIVLKTPIVNDKDSDIDAQFITVPLGIIMTNDMVLTLSPYENPVIDWFVNGKGKNLDPSDRSNFVLRLFERNVYYFLYYLNEINNKRDVYENELYHSSRNAELINLMNIEKSLVYFVTSLRSNELTMLKIQRVDFLNISKKEEEKDLLQDILIDNSQALEMANLYSTMLGGTMDAFASVISNNLNVVMKRLTSVTIVLMVPTLVTSFYGMNVALPMQDYPYANVMVILISLLLATILVMIFVRKKWF